MICSASSAKIDPRTLDLLVALDFPGFFEDLPDFDGDMSGFLGRSAPFAPFDCKSVLWNALIGTTELGAAFSFSAPASWVRFSECADQACRK